MVALCNHAFHARKAGHGIQAHNPVRAAAVGAAVDVGSSSAQSSPNQPGQAWLGLQVKRSELITPDRAKVEFVARYKVGGRAYRIHEVSEFIRRDQAWYYTRASDWQTGGRG